MNPRSNTKTRMDPKQFDAYYAIMDVHRYIKNNFGVEGYKDLLKALEEHATRNFLMWLRFHSYSLKWPSYKKLTRNIDQRHPGLIEDVLSRVRNARESVSKISLKEKVGVTIFKISPRLFVIISWLEGLIRRNIYTKHMR